MITKKCLLAMIEDQALSLEAAMESIKTLEEKVKKLEGKKKVGRPRGSKNKK